MTKKFKLKMRTRIGLLLNLLKKTYAQFVGGTELEGRSLQEICSFLNKKYMVTKVTSSQIKKLAYIGVEMGCKDDVRAGVLDVVRFINVHRNQIDEASGKYMHRNMIADYEFQHMSEIEHLMPEMEKLIRNQSEKTWNNLERIEDHVHAWADRNCSTCRAGGMNHWVKNMSSHIDKVSSSKLMIPVLTILRAKEQMPKQYWCMAVTWQLLQMKVIIGRTEQTDSDELISNTLAEVDKIVVFLQQVQHSIDILNKEIILHGESNLTHVILDYKLQSKFPAVAVQNCLLAILEFLQNLQNSAINDIQKRKFYVSDLCSKIIQSQFHLNRGYIQEINTMYRDIVKLAQDVDQKFSKEDEDSDRLRDTLQEIHRIWDEFHDIETFVAATIHEVISLTQVLPDIIISNTRPFKYYRFNSHFRQVVSCLKAVLKLCRNLSADKVDTCNALEMKIEKMYSKFQDNQHLIPWHGWRAEHLQTKTEQILKIIEQHQTFRDFRYYSPWLYTTHKAEHARQKAENRNKHRKFLAPKVTPQRHKVNKVTLFKRSYKQ